MEPEVDNVEPLSVEEALEKAREKSVFTGHPAEESTPEPGNEETDAEEETDDETGDAEDEGDAEDQDEEPEQKPKPKFKYASHEEAEKGAKEAERRMHEAIEEAKRIRAEVEEIRKQVSVATSKGEVTKEEKKELDALFKEMLGRIKQVDPDDEQYDDVLAKEWAKAVQTVTTMSITEAMQKQAEEAKRIEVERSQAAYVESKAIELAKKAGLDMETNGSVDADLFWSLSRNSVGETLEDRINWTIKKVNDVKSSIAGRTIQSQEKTKKAQAKNKVLERGAANVNTGRKTDEVKPLSISEALEKVQRRI